MRSVAIITPTIGSDHLMQCIKSVSGQTYTYPNITHYMVVDGRQHWNGKVNDAECRAIRGRVCVIPENVGGDGWYGHRIYAAFSYLVNEDYICFLDEDNWLEENHVKKMVDNINNLDWTHC